MRPRSEIAAPMSERLVQAAVQAGLDVVRNPLACPGGISDRASWLAGIVAVSEEWDNEPIPPDGSPSKRLQPVAIVIGFDAPSAEGMGHVPWFAD
jgi:hypothetical protein